MNTQLFENSSLREVYAEQGADSEKLFNSLDPNLAILHEKPHHRLILYMAARDFSNHEIAEASGFTAPWISQVLRQPWARKVLTEELNRAGRDELSGILEGAAKDSLFTLIELRDSAENESVRRSAADSLLDRFLGKPKQSIEHHVDGDLASIDDSKLVAELQADFAKSRKSADGAAKN
jgi:hypothetical protein